MARSRWPRRLPEHSAIRPVPQRPPLGVRAPHDRGLVCSDAPGRAVLERAVPDRLTNGADPTAAFRSRGSVRHSCADPSKMRNSSGTMVPGARRLWACSRSPGRFKPDKAYMQAMRDFPALRSQRATSSRALEPASPRSRHARKPANLRICAGCRSLSSWRLTPRVSSRHRHCLRLLPRGNACVLLSRCCAPRGPQSPVPASCARQRLWRAGHLLDPWGWMVPGRQARLVSSHRAEPSVSTQGRRSSSTAPRCTAARATSEAAQRSLCASWARRARAIGIGTAHCTDATRRRAEAGCRSRSWARWSTVARTRAANCGLLTTSWPPPAPALS